MEPIKTPPSAAELEFRLNKVRAVMERENLDFYASAQTDNVYYLTNFAYFPLERPFFLVIPLEGEPIMILPRLEVSHAEDRVLCPMTYRTYQEYPAMAGNSHIDVLKDVIPSGKRVGVESTLPLIHEKNMPGLVVMTDIIDEARLVKTDYEVGRVMYAGLVADEGLAKCLELSKPGAVELTLYGESVRHMMGKVIMENPGANLLASKFLCGVWPRALSAQPHSVPGLFDQLETGGPNVVIVTAQADGYSAEVERTFFLGEADDESRRLFDIMMDARALGYELIKPGARAEDVDRQVLDLLKKKGCGDYILHRTGHGFGITGHEPPWIALGSSDILEKNMIVSIEPGIYIPGTGGFRHSDTVLITETGCEPLTRARDQLSDLILPAS